VKPRSQGRGWWLAGLLALSSAFAGEERYGWEGQLTYRCWAEPLPCLTGVGDTRWNVNIRLEEGRRVDCRNARGKVVGQFVELREGGSSWTGKEQSYFKHEYPGQIIEYRYSGEGAGQGPVISLGWLYVRLSDDDPLADVLPNGAYAFTCGATKPPAFDTSGLTTITDRSGVQSHTTPFKQLAMLQYGIGQLPLALNPSRWPNSVLATEKKQWVTGRCMEGQDQQMRAAVNNRMSGSFSASVRMGESMGRKRTLHNEARWDLQRVRLVKAHLDEALSYWRPLGGPDSNTVSITAWIEPEEKLTGKFRFTLSEVTQEKGWCLNAGSGTEPDLCFVPQQAGFDAPRAEGSTWIIETLETADRATVTIQASDCGAWGRLKAEVNVDGTWRTCTTTTDGAASITLPLDKNGNRIADDWENDWEVADRAANADKDLKPEDVGDPNEPGDGFSLYEEYRGVKVGGRWTELVPHTREVFVRDEIGCGIGCFANLNLQVCLLEEDEYDAQRVVNFNRGYATLGPQKGIRLRSGTLAGNEGEVRPCVGSPNVVTEVVIDTSMIPAGETSFSLSANRASLIGHELAHAVNVMHHGNEYATWDRRSPLIPATNRITSTPTMIAMPGGKWSGNIGCPMLYDDPLYFVGTDRVLYPFPRGSISEERSVYCNDRVGTGINAGPVRVENGLPYPICGDASAGRCRQSVDIKGNHRNGDQPGW
jgi:hypothetical protein